MDRGRWLSLGPLGSLEDSCVYVERLPEGRLVSTAEDRVHKFTIYTLELTMAPDAEAASSSADDGVQPSPLRGIFIDPFDGEGDGDTYAYLRTLCAEDIPRRYDENRCITLTVAHRFRNLYALAERLSKLEAASRATPLWEPSLEPAYCREHGLTQPLALPPIAAFPKKTIIGIGKNSPKIVKERAAGIEAWLQSALASSYFLSNEELVADLLTPSAVGKNVARTTSNLSGDSAKLAALFRTAGSRVLELRRAEARDRDIKALREAREVGLIVDVPSFVRDSLGSSRLSSSMAQAISESPRSRAGSLLSSSQTGTKPFLNE